jgi:flagellar hook-basal body complex protein FliE
MSALPPIESTGVGVPSVQPQVAAEKPSGGERNVFVDLLSQANADQLRSEAAIEGLVSGENQDVQQVVMEVVKAEMSFQVFMEVRNQIIESYNELMRMQF